MKKIAQKIGKYTLIFLITLLILVVFLVVTARIPRKSIENNIKNNKDIFHTRAEIYETVIGKPYTYRHVYADGISLNIIYCIDNSKPLTSVMQAKYYAPFKEQSTRYFDYNFEEMINNNVEGNVEYLRYWHGYMGIVRILLLFFDLGQIYVFNGVMLSILAIILAILLIKRKAFALTIALIVGSIMGAVYMVPSCIEYVWTFYIMLITSIIAVQLKNNKEKLNVLFFITGVLTCFFDFLTTEILTVGIPVIIVLILNTKEKKINNAKAGFCFVFRSFFLWGISYATMWIAKWVLASIILKINALDYVIEEAKVRINGIPVNDKIENLYGQALIKNLMSLYPIALIKEVKEIIIILTVLIVVETIIIRKNDFKKLWLSGLLILIATIPYIRYLVLANHSYLHYFFTFRSQIITVVAIVLAITYSTNIEFISELIEKVKLKIKSN